MPRNIDGNIRGEFKPLHSIESLSEAKLNSTDKKIEELAEDWELIEEPQETDFSDIQGRITSTKEKTVGESFLAGASTLWASLKGTCGWGYKSEPGTGKGRVEGPEVRSGELLNSGDITRALNDGSYDSCNIFDLSSITFRPGDYNSLLSNIDMSIAHGYDPDKTKTIMPVVYNKGGIINVNHIVLVVVDKEKNRVMYYNSQGESASSFKFNNGKTLEDVLNFCNEKILNNAGLVVENRKTHQQDVHSCGACVINCLRKTVMPEKNTGKPQEDFIDFINRDLGREEIRETKKSVSQERLRGLSNSSEELPSAASSSQSIDDFDTEGSASDSDLDENGFHKT